MWQALFIACVVLAAGTQANGQTASAVCTADSCENGLCDYDTGTCTCHPSYTGENCSEALLTPCDGYYCFNGGSCVEEGGVDRCECKEPYFGDYCIYQPEPCYCLNGGVGCDSLTDYNGSCTCPEGFTGDHCEYEFCTPECPSNAYCCNGTCNCYPGYFGEHCNETEVWEECGTYYCFNNGTCNNGTCECVGTYGGPYCLVDTTGCEDANATTPDTGDTCDSHCPAVVNATDFLWCGTAYCKNGGECVNETCQCIEGTSGQYCEYVQAPDTPPAEFNTTTEADTSVVLEWSAPDGLSDEVGIWYVVDVMAGGPGLSSRSETKCLNLTVPVNASSSYCARVLAVVSGGHSPWSGQICFDGPVEPSFSSSIMVSVSETFQTGLLLPTLDATSLMSTVESATSTFGPQPTTSTEDPQPTTSTEDPQPTTSTEDPQPTTSTEDPQPTTSTEDPQPTTSTEDPQPTTSTVDPQPTTSTEDPQPTSSPVVPSPTPDPFCPMLQENIAEVGNFTWPRSDPEGWVTITCPCDNPDIDKIPVTKYCSSDGTWQDTNAGACIQLGLDKICEETTEEIIEALAEMVSQADTADKLSLAASLITSVGSNVTSMNLGDYYQSLNNILEVNESLVEDADANGQNILNQVIDSMDEAAGLMDGDSVNLTNMVVQKKAIVSSSMPVVDASSGTEFTLPPAVINQCNDADKSVTLFSVFKTTIFPRGFTLSSSISGINLCGGVSNLVEPATITFKNVKTPAPGKINRCAFWNSAIRGGRGGFSSIGIETRFGSGGRISCKTPHFTAFAIYQVPDDGSATTGPEGLTGGAIAGIAAGIIVGFVLALAAVAVLIFLIVRGRRAGKYDVDHHMMSAKGEEIETHENEYVFSAI